MKQIAEQPQQVSERQMVEILVGLELDSDDLLDLLRVLADVDVGNVNVAGIDVRESFDHLERRRLAGAVGAQNPEDVADLDFQRDTIYGVEGLRFAARLRIFLDEIFSTDYRHAWLPLACGTRKNTSKTN